MGGPHDNGEGIRRPPYYGRSTIWYDLCEEAGHAAVVDREPTTTLLSVGFGPL